MQHIRFELFEKVIKIAVYKISICSNISFATRLVSEMPSYILRLSSKIVYRISIYFILNLPCCIVPKSMSFVNYIVFSFCIFKIFFKISEKPTKNGSINQSPFIFVNVIMTFNFYFICFLIPIFNGRINVTIRL